MKLITGHNLRTGIVVYRTAAKGWSENLADAVAYEDADSDAALAEAKLEATQITNVYLIEADGPGQPSKRVLLRESIRAQGPTVRRDLGKQAGN